MTRRDFLGLLSGVSAAAIGLAAPVRPLPEPLLLADGTEVWDAAWLSGIDDMLLHGTGAMRVWLPSPQEHPASFGRSSFGMQALLKDLGGSSFARSSPFTLAEMEELSERTKAYVGTIGASPRPESSPIWEPITDEDAWFAGIEFKRETVILDPETGERI